MADAAFRLGWVLLACLLAAFAVNHGTGFFAFAESDTDRLMFVGLAAMNLLGLVVVLVAYRPGERWAWAATWVPIAATALVVLYVDERSIGYFYLGAALVMALTQAAAWPRMGSVTAGGAARR